MPYDRSTFITRTAIEAMLFDYMQGEEGFLADKLFTPKPVEKSTTKVYQADKSKLRKVIGLNGGTNSEPVLVDEQVFASNITLDQYKYGADIDPVNERDADDPVKRIFSEQRKAKLCAGYALIEREAAAVTAVTNTSNYPAASTSAIASGSRWNEAGGDPEADMKTAVQAVKNSCGMRPNALAIGDATLDKLVISPAFRARTQYTNGGPVTKEMIKAFFGVDYLFVGDARVDSGIEGGTASIAGFWSDYAVAYCYNPAAALESVSFGHMYLMNSPFWSTTQIDPKREGPAGPMRRVTVGTEYKLGAGMVVASGDGDFAAGYLFRTVVA